MAAPTTRMTINISHYLHKRLRHLAFIHETTMTSIMERGTEGAVDYLEADDSIVTGQPKKYEDLISASVKLTTEQAKLFYDALAQRGERAEDVLERMVMGYIGASQKMHK